MTELSGKIKNQSVEITWKAPFTLNLTNTEPDITYCVQMSNNSNGYKIVHVCNVTETKFVYTLLDIRSSCCESSSCTINASVVPINGAGDGLPSQTQILCKPFKNNNRHECIDQSM